VGRKGEIRQDQLISGGGCMHTAGRKKGEFDEGKGGYIQYEQYEQYERVYMWERQKRERDREKKSE
jgi:hypothetical protein